MYESIPALIAGMQADLAVLRAGDDRRRYFHATYLRSTQAFDREIRRGGFADGAWLERWDLVFAGLYLNALAADLRGDPVPRPWRGGVRAPRGRGGPAPP